MYLVFRSGFKIDALNGRNERRQLQFFDLLHRFFRLTWPRPTTPAPLATPYALSTMITDGPAQWARQCQRWLQSLLLLFLSPHRIIHSHRLDMRFFHRHTHTRVLCPDHIWACPSNNRPPHQPNRPFNNRLAGPGKCPFHLRLLYKISNAAFPMAESCGVVQV